MPVARGASVSGALGVTLLSVRATPPDYDRLSLRILSEPTLQTQEVICALAITLFVLPDPYVRHEYVEHTSIMHYEVFDHFECILSCLVSSVGLLAC